jgi:hypothetical protein
MGRQTGVKFIGTIDGVIYYIWKGIYCMRSMPGFFNQTAATQETASVLGRASNQGKLLRKGLEPLSPNPKLKGMQNRLQTAIQYMINMEEGHNMEDLEEKDTLQSFVFNEKARCNNIFSKMISATYIPGKGVGIDIQAFNPAGQFRYPGSVKKLRFILAAVVVNTRKKELADTCYIQAEIDYADKDVAALHFDLPVEAGKACLVTATVAVQFCATGRDEKSFIQNLRYLPMINAGAWTL